MRKCDSGYQTLEFHTISISHYYALDYLECRTLLIDRPRYNFQQSLWIAYSHILKSKIEQNYFEEKVLVMAEVRKTFEITIQKILNPAYWCQITDIKNFGTIDEGPSLYGTIYLKRIKNFCDPAPEKKYRSGIKLFDSLYEEIQMYTLKELGIEKLKDPRVKNRVIEEKMKQKFPELSLIFIRELVSFMRKDLR